ncbi:MAG: L,D-transpeptidase family protein [Planctomycetes bacterium]|nr:L,D-transpeptidase family protein [Planctomycetota bacterium]
MRLFWGLGFALVVALGFWVGFRGRGQVEGHESSGFLDESSVSERSDPALGAAAAGAPGAAWAAGAAGAAGEQGPTGPTGSAGKGAVGKGQAPAPNPAAAPASAKAAPAAPLATLPAARALQGSEEEIEIAAILLHRPWSEVSVRLGQSRLPEDRRNLFAAVSASLAGDRERAQGFAKGLDKSDELSARERALLASALQAAPVAPVAAAAGTDSVAAMAITLALRARDGARMLAAGRHAEAASAFSEVLLGDALANWPSDRTALQRWSDGLNQAQAGHRWNVKGNWPSVTITVKSGDSLTSLRQRALKEHSGLLLCTGLIQRVNQLRNEKDLHPGDVLRLPTDRAHMVVDISTRWVLYMMGNEVVSAWEGGVGKPGNDTVPGNYVIGGKLKNPTWFRPGAKPVPFGDPENPLGTRWLAWLSNGVDSSLGFHGTTDPSSVGGAVSSGCIRMRNEDVEVLYEILPEKAEVLVQP